MYVNLFLHTNNLNLQYQINLDDDSILFTFKSKKSNFTIDKNRINEYSRLVETVLLDANAAEINIPSFDGYSQSNIDSHLHIVLQKVSNKLSLKEDKFLYSNKTLHHGVFVVPDTIDNLIIWLLLTNWLDIPRYFNEIVETLTEYTLKIEDIPK